MAAPKSFTQRCMELGDVAEAMSDVASQHSSGSGSSGSGSGSSGPPSAAPSLHEAMHEAVSSPMRQTSSPFDEVPQRPFEDPIPEPVLDGEALPKPFSPRQSAQQSPLPPAPKPVQRRVSKQEAIRRSILSPKPTPVIRSPKPTPVTRSPKQSAVVAKPFTDDNTDRNKQLMTYVLIPTLAFVATYFGGPLVAPGFFQNKLTGEQDSKKAFIAAMFTACGSIVAARCVL